MTVYSWTGRLLALSLTFLCFELCYPLPTESLALAAVELNTDALSPQLLEKRNDYEALIEELENAVIVEQGTEDFISWGAKVETLGSTGLAGCIGILIAGDGGAIMGHYADSDVDVNKALSRLPDLITKHKAALSDATAYLYAEVDLKSPNVYVSEANNLKLINLVRKSLGITPKREKYIQPELLMYDEEGEIRDDCLGELIYGAMMVQHPGGRGIWKATFIDVEWQKRHAAGNP